jgi:GDP-L-fucose synthase
MGTTEIFSRMRPDARIFVAGHRGLVGSAIVRALHNAGYQNVLTFDRSQVDLVDQAAVNELFRTQAFDFVFMAAAKVGGILYNSQYPADFLYNNMMIAANVIHAAAVHDVEKLLYLGSSCIYPREAPQPLEESSLLTGPLEPTNEAYAIAKIAGLKLCEKYRDQYGKNFISVMPTNLFGPGDNFHPQHSHVVPGLLRRFHEAKERGDGEVVVWGSGNPRREFLYVDDLAQALLVLMDRYDERSTINVGTGIDVTIRELANMIAEVVGYRGVITFDATKPDGTPRKVLDVQRVSGLGWRAETSLGTGLAKTYGWALKAGVFGSGCQSRERERRPN